MQCFGIKVVWEVAKGSQLELWFTLYEMLKPFIVLWTNYCIRIRTISVTSRASQFDCSIVDTNVLILNVNLNGISLELF